MRKTDYGGFTIDESRRLQDWHKPDWSYIHGTISINGEGGEDGLLSQIIG